MRESAVENHLVKRVREAGGEAIKLYSAGWPDRLVLLPAHACFVETKRPKGGRLAEHQKAAHALIRRLHFDVHVLSSKAEVDSWIESVAG